MTSRALTALLSAALLLGLIVSGCAEVREVVKYNEVRELVVETQQEFDEYVPREFRCAVATAGVVNLDDDASLVRVLFWTGAQRAACEGLESVNACDVYEHLLEHAGDRVPERYQELVRAAYFTRCGG